MEQGFPRHLETECILPACAPLVPGITNVEDEAFTTDRFVSRRIWSLYRCCLSAHTLSRLSKNDHCY